MPMIRRSFIRQMPRALLLAAPGLALLAVAGCQRHEEREDGQRTASGEVLSGSVSDSMVSYEAQTAQPPVAPASAAKTGPEADADNALDVAQSAADAAGSPMDLTPSPAASPSAKPSGDAPPVQF
jgi:hypothetical protein